MQTHRADHYQHPAYEQWKCSPALFAQCIAFTAHRKEGMTMMWGYPFSWGSMLLMTLNMLLWVALMGILRYTLVRWLNIPRQTTPIAPSEPLAPQILEQRYAHGKIDEATFDRMHERFQSSAAPQ
jgi:uncharacterized membrane protein